MKSVLSSKVLDNELIVLDSLNFDAPKTKNMVEVLKNINANKALIVVASNDENVYRSARNIPEIATATVDSLNVYDMLKYYQLVVTKEAAQKIEEVYA